MIVFYKKGNDPMPSRDYKTIKAAQIGILLDAKNGEVYTIYSRYFKGFQKTYVVDNNKLKEVR